MVFLGMVVSLWDLFYEGIEFVNYQPSRMRRASTTAGFWSLYWARIHSVSGSVATVGVRSTQPPKMQATRATRMIFMLSSLTQTSSEPRQEFGSSRLAHKRTGPCFRPRRSSMPDARQRGDSCSLRGE